MMKVYINRDDLPASESIARAFGNLMDVSDINTGNLAENLAVGVSSGVAPVIIVRKNVLAMLATELLQNPGKETLSKCVFISVPGGTADDLAWKGEGVQALNTWELHPDFFSHVKGASLVRILSSEKMTRGISDFAGSGSKLYTDILSDVQSFGSKCDILLYYLNQKYKGEFSPKMRLHLIMALDFFLGLAGGDGYPILNVEAYAKNDFAVISVFSKSKIISADRVKSQTRDILFGEVRRSLNQVLVHFSEKKNVALKMMFFADQKTKLSAAPVFVKAFSSMDDSKPENVKYESQYGFAKKAAKKSKGMQLAQKAMSSPFDVAEAGMKEAETQVGGIPKQAADDDPGEKVISGTTEVIKEENVVLEGERENVQEEKVVIDGERETQGGSVVIEGDREQIMTVEKIMAGLDKAIEDGDPVKIKDAFETRFDRMKDDCTRKISNMAKNTEDILQKEKDRHVRIEGSLQEKIKELTKLIDVLRASDGKDEERIKILSKNFEEKLEKERQKIDSVQEQASRKEKVLRDEIAKMKETMNQGAEKDRKTEMIEKNLDAVKTQNLKLSQKLKEKSRSELELKNQVYQLSEALKKFQKKSE